MSALVTWDSKITTVNAILGGVTDFVRQRLRRDGIYDEFISIATVRIPGPCPLQRGAGDQGR